MYAFKDPNGRKSLDIYIVLSTPKEHGRIHVNTLEYMNLKV